MILASGTDTLIGPLTWANPLGLGLPNMPIQCPEPPSMMRITES